MKTNRFIVLFTVFIAIIAMQDCSRSYRHRKQTEKNFEAYLAAETTDTVWRGWNKYQIPFYSDSGKLIWYGHELIANTAYYLGPKGIVAHTTNGMNCQNCHLDGGTIPYGNNFGKVYATYPQFRARNNRTQNIYDRINDCFERSLNGQPLDSNTHEMRALYAYIKWLGEEVPKGVVKKGTGIMKLRYLNRAADPVAGKKVYQTKCQSCHGDHGQGQKDPGSPVYSYPPLWGKHSYNDGGGLYRIGNFAGFVKNNMPYGTGYHNPVLTTEEAWDVAAFVNSRPRPHKDQQTDWKNTGGKPIDFPFGPYTDPFTEQQHKYGPFAPIKEFRKTIK